MLRTEVRSEVQRTEARGRLEELYRAHAPDAARLAYLLLGDRELARDVVQDAFVRLYGRFGDIRHPEAFHAYLRRTVVNLVRSHFRHRRVERAYLERQRAERGAPEPGPGRRHEVWEALRRLPARQREALVLRYYEDLTESEIADLLRCRPGTVKSLTSRGIERLREDLSRGE